MTLLVWKSPYGIHVEIDLNFEILNACHEKYQINTK